MALLHGKASVYQLASRIGAVIRYGAAGGDDPFTKVKGLITDMISKLEAESASEATEKADPPCMPTILGLMGWTLDLLVESLSYRLDP